MKYHKQLFRHDPDNGVYGDCARTVLACLFDLEPSDVPHFAELSKYETRLFVELQEAWLAEQGLRTLSVLFLAVEDALGATRGVNATFLFQLVGKSRNGTNHVVIAQNGRIIHDPAIDDSGIVGPASDGYVHLELLVPLRFTQVAQM